MDNGSEILTYPRFSKAVCHSANPLDSRHFTWASIEISLGKYHTRTKKLLVNKHSTLFSPKHPRKNKSYLELEKISN